MELRRTLLLASLVSLGLAWSPSPARAVEVIVEPGIPNEPCNPYWHPRIPAWCYARWRYAPRPYPYPMPYPYTPYPPHRVWLY